MKITLGIAITLGCAALACAPAHAAGDKFVIKEAQRTPQPTQRVSNDWMKFCLQVSDAAETVADGQRKGMAKHEMLRVMSEVAEEKEMDHIPDIYMAVLNDVYAGATPDGILDACINVGRGK